jgi:hypothetical protein
MHGAATPFLRDRKMHRASWLSRFLEIDASNAGCLYRFTTRSLITCGPGLRQRLPAVVTCGCASRRTGSQLTQGLPQKVDFQTLASAPCPSISSGAATMVLAAIQSLKIC